jgi:hypothetical protein
MGIHDLDLVGTNCKFSGSCWFVSVSFIPLKVYPQSPMAFSVNQVGRWRWREPGEEKAWSLNKVQSFSLTTLWLLLVALLLGPSDWFTLEFPPHLVLDVALLLGALHSFRLKASLATSDKAQMLLLWPPKMQPNQNNPFTKLRKA